MQSMRSRPHISGAETAHWNREALKKPDTWVRSGYNVYLTARKCGYLWEIAKFADPLHFVRASFQAFAVPLAQKTGSKTLEKCAYAASETLGALFTPISWSVGTACNFVGKFAADQITKKLDIKNPEYRDLVEVIASECSTYSALQITGHIDDQRKKSDEKITAFAQKQIELASQNGKVVNANQINGNLAERAQQIQALSHDPQNIANDAYNRAEAQGLKGNKIEIALQASSLLSQYSLDPVPNRSFDTMAVGITGRNTNSHLVKRIGEILNEINSENQQILAASRSSLDAESMTLQQTRGEFVEARANINFFDRINHALNPHLSARQKPVPRNRIDSKWDGFRGTNEDIANLYIQNEDKAKRLLSIDGVDLSSKNGKTRFKIMVSNLIVNDLCEISKNESQRNTWTRQIFDSMDKSDRRWYNDVSGELHKIIHGSETADFKYKDRGVKKVYKETLRPVKKTASWLDKHQSGDRFTAQTTLTDKRELYLGTSSNKKITKLYEPKKPSKPLFELKRSVTLAQSPVGKPGPKKPQVLSRSKKTEQVSTRVLRSAFGSASQKQKTLGKETTPVVVSNLKNGLTLANSAQNALMGYSPFAKGAHTLVFADEIKRNGFARGGWNATVDVVAGHAVGNIPVVGKVIEAGIALSELYDKNVSPEKACEMEREVYDASIRGTRGLMWKSFVEPGLHQDLLDCQTRDRAARAASRAMNGITGTVKFK